jgi:uncharacterized protein YjdB
VGSSKCWRRRAPNGKDRFGDRIRDRLLASRQRVTRHSSTPFQVIWASSNEAVATVGSTPQDFGVVTAVASGEATISATDLATNAIGRSTVLVARDEPSLRAVSVTPNPATITVGQMLQLHAWAVFCDGSVRDVSSSAAWTSPREDVATVDANGLATGVAAGETTISATAGGAGDGGVPFDLVRGSTPPVVR